MPSPTHPIKVKAGTRVLKQGTPGKQAYRIERGKIEIAFKDTDGEEIKLAELGPDEIIGEMAPLLGGRRCASAIAREDSVLVPISAEELEESMITSPRMFHYLVELVLGRMNDTHIRRLKKNRQKLMGKKFTRTRH